MKNQKVNLFLVGGPRCASTTMYDFLSQNPEVFMSKFKEPFYFCTDLVEESDKHHGKPKFYTEFRDLDTYHSLFEKSSTEKYLGEATTWNLFSQQAAQNIYQYNPEAKIIIMVRNPVDFLYSLHGLFLATVNEDITNFEQALNAENQRLQGNRLPSLVTFPSRLQYSQVGAFSNQIKRYLKVFADNQVKVVLVDDLKTDPSSVYKEILNFLELDPNFQPVFKHRNKNRVVRSPKIVSWLKKSPIFTLSNKFIPPVAKKHLYWWTRNIFYSFQPRKKLDENTRNKIMGKFKEEVNELSQLLNRDLSGLWGYEKLS